MFLQGGGEVGEFNGFEQIGDPVGGERVEQVVVVSGREYHRTRRRLSAEEIERKPVAQLDVGENKIGRRVAGEPLGGGAYTVGGAGYRCCRSRLDEEITDALECRCLV